MMTTQLALDFPRPRGKGPKVTQFYINQLIQTLFEHPGWLTATDLGFHTESDKRILRALAAASKGHVISGQAGYRLNFQATADENRVAVNQLKSQHDMLARRIIEIERVYHRKEIPECLRARVEAARPAA